MQRRQHRSHWYPCPSGLVMTLGLLVLLAGASAMTAAQPVPFTVGISGTVNTALPIWMAEAGGFFRDQGLDVDVVNMRGGSRGARALQAGRIDAMHVGLSSVLQVNQAGGDLRVVASVSNEIRFTLVVDPAVTSAAELRGGVVAVSTFGSESDATVTLALQRLGLTRDEVVLREYGDGMRRIDAVTSGEARATTVNEPFTSLASARGLRAMVDLATDHIPWLFSGIVVKQGYLAEHRDLVTRFVKALMEGHQLALSNEPLAKDVLARETAIGDPRIVESSYEDFRMQTPANLELTRTAAENVIAHLEPGTGLTVDEYVDTGIIDALTREGFIAALQQKYAR